MKFVKKEEAAALNRQLFEDHGVVTKLLGDDGQPIGYFVRREIKPSGLNGDDFIQVVVNISFNASYENREWKRKPFAQSDMKFFAMKKTYSDNLKNVLVAEYRGALDDAAGSWMKLFEMEVNGIIDSKLDKRYLLLSANGLEQYAGDEDSLKSFLVFKAKNVVKYYKNKNIRLYFI